ncbi:MAG: capsid cement protein [Rhodospirillaceae bacterium]
MTTYRPVVLINGKFTLLPAGDTLSAKVQEVDIIDMVAKDILLAGMVVYCSAGFQIMKAKADDDAKAEVLGLVAAAAAIDASVQVQTDGVLELADWTGVVGATSLTAGADYYVDTTAGQLTATVPSTGNLVCIGRAIAPQKLEISIQRPIKLT